MKHRLARRAVQAERRVGDVLPVLARVRLRNRVRLEAKLRGKVTVMVRVMVRVRVRVRVRARVRVRIRVREREQGLHRREEGGHPRGVAVHLVQQLLDGGTPGLG